MKRKKKTHKFFIFECECGFRTGMTEIQKFDFEPGIMGILRCVGCNKILMPTHMREVKVNIEVKRRKGQDPGWC